MNDFRDIRMYDAAAVAAATPYQQLIPKIAATFASPPVTPERAHYNIDDNVTLLSMPSWRVGDYIGQKLVTVAPDNPAQGLRTTNGVYLLFDAATGVPRAVMDAPSLTARRTAAVSACAADKLARNDAAAFLIVGTGPVARALVCAHATVRAYRTRFVWARNRDKATAFADDLTRSGIDIQAAEDLEEAVRRADIISCATTAREPLIQGDWLRPGSHLELVGSFKPAMRECDSRCLARSRVFVDNLAGALTESGEIIAAIDARVISADDIVGDLKGLLCGEVAGRMRDTDITLFKSVGTAISDYAAASLIVD